MSVSSRLSTVGASAALVMLTVATGGLRPARAAGPLDPYLPKSGTIVGHVVTFAMSPEDQAISMQFRQAVQKNMDFFKKSMTSNTPGQPLPYDKHMGISEVQYDRLLHMTPQVKEGADVTIAVQKGADGAIAFKPQDPQSQPLKDVTFPPDEALASTPFGKLSILNQMHQKDTAPWGAWNGVEWAQVMPPEADQPSAKIAFGKRESDGEGVMYYQVAPYQDHEQQSLVVMYKLDQ